jgi:cell division protein FtsL
VNKLVKKSRFEYINGSTVYAPERLRESPLKKEKYEKLRKTKIERINRVKKKKNAQKRRVMVSIITVFGVGLSLIWGEAQVYGNQMELTKIKKEIVDVNRQNDDLKIQLLKVSSLENIKQNAENKLHMIIPDRKNVIYADLSKDNFNEETKDGSESKTKDLWLRIKNLLF